MLKKYLKLLCCIGILFSISYNKVLEINYTLKTKKDIILNREYYMIINKDKLIIKKGDEQSILDNNYVYLMDISDKNHLYLAGHNNRLVFNRIYNLNIKDNIYIYMKNIEKYEVTERRYIRVNDYSIYNKNDDEKNLFLITCTNNNQKRFIIICKKI